MYLIVPFLICYNDRVVYLFLALFGLYFGSYFSASSILFTNTVDLLGGALVPTLLFRIYYLNMFHILSLHLPYMFPFKLIRFLRSSLTTFLYYLI